MHRSFQAGTVAREKRPGVQGTRAPSPRSHSLPCMACLCVGLGPYGQASGGFDSLRNSGGGRRRETCKPVSGKGNAPGAEQQQRPQPPRPPESRAPEGAPGCAPSVPPRSPRHAHVLLPLLVREPRQRRVRETWACPKHRHQEVLLRVLLRVLLGVLADGHCCRQFSRMHHLPCRQKDH